MVFSVKLALVFLLVGLGSFGVLFAAAGEDKYVPISGVEIFLGFTTAVCYVGFFAALVCAIIMS